MLRAWVATLCLAQLAASNVAAPRERPYSVDDMLALEGLGQVAIDPHERLVVFERRRRYDSAPDYSYWAFTGRSLSKLLVATLDRPSAPQPLFPQDDGAGYWMGDFSPDGSRLTVFRLASRRLDLGVVDVATRRVTWLPIAPDLPPAHPPPVWRDDHTLVAVAFADRRLPAILGMGSGAHDDLRRLWLDAARGTVPSSTVLDAGAASALAPRRIVVRIDVPSGVVETIATGNITDLTVSRRGYVAVASTVAPEAPPGPPLSQAFAPLRHAIDVLTPGSRSPIRVADDALPANMAWDEDGRRLAFVAKSGADWSRARVRIAHVGGRSASLSTVPLPLQSSISQGSALLTRVFWAGRRLLVESGAGADGAHWRSVRYSGRLTPASDLGPGRLALAVPSAAWLADSGRLRRVALDGSSAGTAADGVVSTGVGFLDPSSVGARLLFNPRDAVTAVVERRSGILAVRALGRGGLGSPMPIRAGAAVLAVAARHAVTFREDERGVGVMSLLTVGAADAELARINGFLADRSVPRVVELRAKLSDGAEHSSWLVLPAPAADGRRPPLLALVYPGGLSDDRPPGDLTRSAFRPMTGVPIAIGHGFAVLIPGLPDRDPGKGRLERLAHDATAAVDRAVATGLVDPSRVALFGHSFGGYGALGIATRSKRFGAVVAASGPYDLTAIYGQMAGPDRIRVDGGLPFVSSAAWDEAGQGALGVPPWSDPARYAVVSPLYSLDRVTAPVLLLGADGDYVALDQAEAAFMGLARLGRDATLIRYWGEGHVLASPANIRDYWSRILGWLDARLASPVGRATSGGASPRSSTEVRPTASIGSPTPRTRRG